MRKHLRVLFIMGVFMTLSSYISVAQVGINDLNSAPDSSAMLDVHSTSKGMLVPRMTIADRNLIHNPATALLIYQTDADSAFYYFDGVNWKKVGNASDGSETKIQAGANVEITGNGTDANPYIINSYGGGGGDTTAKYVGQLFGGGIVCYVDHTGHHGLICSLVDLTNSIQWNPSTGINNGSFSTWNGLANTNALLPVSPAAQLCASYVNLNYGTGVFDDWYLPALDQVATIYRARYTLNKLIDGVSGYDVLSNNTYWTSTEITNFMAWGFSFSYGNSNANTKSNYYYLRAIRNF